MTIPALPPSVQIIPNPNRAKSGTTLYGEIVLFIPSPQGHRPGEYGPGDALYSGAIPYMVIQSSQISGIHLRPLALPLCFPTQGSQQGRVVVQGYQNPFAPEHPLMLDFAGARALAVNKTPNGRNNIDTRVIYTPSQAILPTGDLETHPTFSTALFAALQKTFTALQPPRDHAKPTNPIAVITHERCLLPLPDCGEPKPRPVLPIGFMQRHVNGSPKSIMLAVLGGAPNSYPGASSVLSFPTHIPNSAKNGEWHTEELLACAIARREDRSPSTGRRHQWLDAKMGQQPVAKIREAIGELMNLDGQRLFNKIKANAPERSWQSTPEHSPPASPARL